MKRLIIKQIKSENISVCELSTIFDSEGVDYNPIANANWEKYPYTPSVKFRIAHDNNNIYLNFVVQEKSVRARYYEDNSKVWTDSCVEFFIIPPDSDNYYNLECNCIGTILLGGGSKRKERIRATSDVIKKIKRWSSLGDTPFEEIFDNSDWEVSLIIPKEVFFLDTIKEFSGKTARANFYKCGDELSTPHYISWNPIECEKPNFHLTSFFGDLLFR